MKTKLFLAFMSTLFIHSAYAAQLQQAAPQHHHLTFREEDGAQVLELSAEEINATALYNAFGPTLLRTALQRGTSLTTDLHTISERRTSNQENTPHKLIVERFNLGHQKQTLEQELTAPLTEEQQSELKWQTTKRIGLACGCLGLGGLLYFKPELVEQALTTASSTAFNLSHRFIWKPLLSGLSIRKRSWIYWTGRILVVHRLTKKIAPLVDALERPFAPFLERTPVLKLSLNALFGSVVAGTLVYASDAAFINWDLENFKYLLNTYPGTMTQEIANTMVENFKNGAR